MVSRRSAGCVLGELLLNRPLLSGKSELHQVDLIIDMFGSPNPAIWPVCGYQVPPPLSSASRSPSSLCLNRSSEFVTLNFTSLAGFRASSYSQELYIEKTAVSNHLCLTRGSTTCMFVVLKFAFVCLYAMLLVHMYMLG